MTILSDGAIYAMATDDESELQILPYSDVNLQPASYDVRLGKTLYDVDANTTVESDSHTLEPFQRYLGHTEEMISLPDDIAAQLAGRSTIGRKGVIVHKTAGFLDPSFTGQVTLEIMNLGTEPVTLEVGSRVAQLVFFELDQPSSGYDGKYQGQTGPTKPR